VRNRKSCLRAISKGKLARAGAAGAVVAPPKAPPGLDQRMCTSALGEPCALSAACQPSINHGRRRPAATMLHAAGLDGALMVLSWCSHGGCAPAVVVAASVPAGVASDTYEAAILPPGTSLQVGYAVIPGRVTRCSVWLTGRGANMFDADLVDRLSCQGSSQRSAHMQQHLPNLYQPPAMSPSLARGLLPFCACVYVCMCACNDAITALPQHQESRPDH